MAKNDMLAELAEVVRLLDESGKVDISQFQDGKWTIEGPDSAIRALGASTRFIRTHHAKLKAMAIDALRYRWLRDATKRDWTVTKDAVGGGIYQYYGGEPLDRAIDDAMRAENSHD